MLEVLARDRGMRGRKGSALAVLAVIGATAFLFWPLAVGAATGAPRFFEWDVPEQYWPDLVYLCGALHEGELPAWNPYDRAGYPYYADPQSAQYHPTSWAICALAGPQPSLGWATFRVPLAFALAGLFGLLWLRRIGASAAGAIAGAVLIEAAPFMRHNWELNLTGALAYLPLMLWAADRLAVERRVRDGALLALAVALAGWMGSPPALWQASIFTGLYFVFRLGEQVRLHRRALVEVALPLAPAVVLSAGMLAAVLIPGAELAAHSVQAGRSFESIADGGLGPGRLWALLWPQPGNHLYVGWLALALGAVALRRREDRLPIFFWVAALLSVLLAMGAHGPLFRFAFEHVPGVHLFRLPHRYEAWLGPAFGGLVALGLTELARMVRRRPAIVDIAADAARPMDVREARCVDIAADAASPTEAGSARCVDIAADAARPTEAGSAGRVDIAADAGSPVETRGDVDIAARPTEAGEVSAGGVDRRPSEVSASFVGRVRALSLVLALCGSALLVLLAGDAPGLFLLGVAVLSAAVTMPGGLGSAWTGLALAALILLDLTQMMPADRHTRGGDPPADPEVAGRVLPFLRGAGDRWRMMDEFALSCRAGTRLRRRDLRGYQDPLMLASYEGVIDSLAEHPGLAPQFGVRYALSSPHFIHGWDHHYLPRPDVLSARLRSSVLWQEGQRRVIELEDALPFAYFVPDEDVERVPDRHAALARVKALAPAPIAVLEGGASGVRTEPARPLAAARDVQLERDTLSFAIEAPSRGVVIVNEAYYPGWRASMDGREVDIERANALVRAVHVTPGPHRIRMRFSPRGLTALRAALLLSFLAALAFVFVPLRRRTRTEPCNRDGRNAP